MSGLSYQEPTESKRSPGRKPNRVLSWLLVLVGMAGAAYLLWQWLSVVPLVEVEEASIEELWTSFSAEGVFKGTEYAVGSEAGGRVVLLSVREGDDVERGQMLFRLDTEDTAFAKSEMEEAYKAALAAAGQARREKDFVARQHKANVAAAAARVTQAERELSRTLSGARPEEKDQAHQRVVRAGAALEETEKALRRAEALFQADAISRADLERAEAAYKAAAAEVHSAESAEALLRAGASDQEIAVVKAAVDAAVADLKRVESEDGRIGIADQAIQVANARVGQASAALQRARSGVKRYAVFAPASGTVTKLNFEVGAVMMPAVTALIVSTRRDLRIEAEISTEDVPKINSGMEVDVTSAAYPGRTFRAKVTSLLPTGELKPDAAIRTRIVRARIVLLDEPQLFRPGMEVDVEGRRPLGKRLTVPTDAIRYVGESVSVLMVEDGRVVERKISIGIQNANRTEVTSGLREGERIILRGKDELIPGDTVQVKL